MRVAVDSGNNQSVERAAQLLRALADAGHTRVRASDLAAAAGLGLSTASRLLATLESLDFVERDPVTSLYRLGPLALLVGGAAANQQPVHREARQVAQNLAARLGLGVNVARRNGDRLVYLVNAEGQLAPRSFTLLGQTNPLHATGLGKCLLLGCAAEERRALLGDGELTAFTAKTVTSLRALEDELARARSLGYATEVEELALGRACLAAPVRDRDGAVVAAISVSGSLSALDLPNRRDELAQLVIETADTVSTALGYTATALHRTKESR